MIFTSSNVTIIHVTSTVLLLLLLFFLLRCSCFVTWWKTSIIILGGESKNILDLSAGIFFPEGLRWRRQCHRCLSAAVAVVYNIMAFIQHTARRIYTTIIMWVGKRWRHSNIVSISPAKRGKGVDNVKRPGTRNYYRRFTFE